MPIVFDTLPGAGKARDLHDFCMSHEGSPIVLDAAGLASLTAANLQVLLNLQGVKANEGQTFQITNMTDGFRNSLVLLGVDPATFQGEATE